MIQHLSVKNYYCYEIHFTIIHFNRNFFYLEAFVLLNTIRKQETLIFSGLSIQMEKCKHLSCPITIKSLRITLMKMQIIPAKMLFWYILTALFSIKSQTTTSVFLKWQNMLESVFLKKHFRIKFFLAIFAHRCNDLLKNSRIIQT